MECDDRPLLNEWMAACRDLIDFEVVSVITSAESGRGCRAATLARQRAHRLYLESNAFPLPDMEFE